MCRKKDGTFDTWPRDCRVVRFVNNTGNYLTIKRTKSSCLVNVEPRISYYLSSGPFHGIIGESCHFRRRHLSKTVPYNIISAGMQPIHRERSIVRSGTIAPFRSQSSFPGKQLVLSRLHTNQPTG